MNQIKTIYTTLLNLYGLQGWWPLLQLGSVEYKHGDKRYGGYHPGDYSYPKTQEQVFEICVGAILTQNTAWNNVIKALHKLNKAGQINPHKIISTKDEKLQELIKPAGYFRQKTRKLKEFSMFFIALDGKTPSRKELLEVWGIGPETADSILLYAYKKPEFVIDAYTKRLFAGKGIIEKRISYEALKKLFEDNLAKDYKLFQEYHALIVEHAKQLK